MATIEDLLAQARRDLDDPEQPGEGDDSLSLFPDAELIGYLNRALDEACIRSELILDSDTPDVAVIDVVAGQAQYFMDPRVLMVKRAKIAGNFQPQVLDQTDRDTLDRYRPEWESATGVPKYFLQDMNQTLRLYPTPDRSGRLHMTVWRRPLKPLKGLNPREEPTIPPEHHFKLLDWVYYLALSKQDVDTYDPQQAQAHGQAFMEWFGPRKSAWEMAFDRKKNPDLRVPSRFM